MSNLTQFYGGGGSAGHLATMSNPKNTGFPSSINVDLYDVFYNDQGVAGTGYSLGTQNYGQATYPCRAGVYQDLEMVGVMPTVPVEMEFKGWKNLKNINLWVRYKGGSFPNGWTLKLTPNDKSGVAPTVPTLVSIDGLTLDAASMWSDQGPDTSTGITLNIKVLNNTTLTSVSNFNLYLPDVDLIPTGIMPLYQFQFNNCGLDQTSVDHIIKTVKDAVELANYALVRVGSVLDVSGGTNAAPSAAVSDDIAYLTSRNMTITRNS